MSNHYRPHELRLAKISDLGSEAYAVARKRAEQANSDILPRDWSVVAIVISRRTAKRSSPFAWMFH
jgi:hypothetical protein